MKEVSYKNPYESDVFIQIEDDDVEGLEEVLSYLNDNTRIIQNLEQKEREHTKYHYEGLEYEGMEYSSWEDVSAEATERMEEQIIDEWLRKNLTEAQYRRFRLLMKGCSIREIVRIEECDYSSANETIKAARKKLQKRWKT